METATRWLAADRYEVGEVVGRGGYGMVRRGFDRKTGQEVALKMLSPESGRNADAVERMLREQQAMLALAGTCAVTAIDLFRLPSGAPCLVMEWLEGCDLEQQLAAWEEAGQLGPLDELLVLVEPIARTLEQAHALGIVHRDIKPANIFLSAGTAPGIRLLDFGLSRMKSAAPLTAVGVVMGSPSYIAPETWRGNSALLDGRADLFALAVIVFRFLTGKLPFDIPDLIGKMTAVTSGPRPSVTALRPELPPTIDAWMSRALAVEPGDRFQTGGEFYGSLAAALRAEPWPAAHAGASAPRGIDESTPERKSALANAWQAAASLLKRFTGQRDSRPPGLAPSAPPTRAVSNTPAKPSSAPVKPTRPPIPSVPRATHWLDSTELHDLVSGEFTAPGARVAEPGTPPAPQPETAAKEAAAEPSAAEKAVAELSAVEAAGEEPSAVEAVGAEPKAVEAAGAEPSAVEADPAAPPKKRKSRRRRKR